MQIRYLKTWFLFVGYGVSALVVAPLAAANPHPNSLIYIEFKPGDFPGELRPLVSKISAASSEKDRDKRQNLFTAAIEEARRLDNRVNRAYTDRVWFLRGYAEHRLDKPEEALRSFEASLKLRPDNALSIFYHGLSLRELNRCKEAIPRFQEVVWLVPSMQAEPLYFTASCQDTLGKGDEARKNYVAAVEKGATLPDSLKKYIEIKTSELESTPDPKIRAQIQKDIHSAKSKLPSKDRRVK